jgi:hypothetical protein
VPAGRGQAGADVVPAGHSRAELHAAERAAGVVAEAAPIPFVPITLVCRNLRWAAAALGSVLTCSLLALSQCSWSSRDCQLLC